MCERERESGGKGGEERGPEKEGKKEKRGERGKRKDDERGEKKIF